ncbi:MAG TPA: hypothetical protein VE360_14355 [Pyrinomonadaceae bacterium]|nr:hypothetical protein [Pyrinomonadaceae bacterium]
MLADQTILMPLNAGEAQGHAEILHGVRPNEVHPNVQGRRIPREWRVEPRGNMPDGVIRRARVRHVGAGEVARIEQTIRRLAGVKTITSYRRRLAVGEMRGCEVE